ncbi:MAG: isopentenyl-diphosphate Delta-isomerase [Planctomycetota bacterium]|jgi:isopentenyl-diphosphate delta-isomerase
MEEVILVDEEDRQIGVSEKLAAHRDGGRLHRAFSVFVFNREGRLLLQRRAATKYHFGGLWTNSCCGHPRPGETTAGAAARRMQEELGFTAAVQPLFTHAYQAKDASSGLTENEIDHVMRSEYEGPVTPDPAEIDAFAWRFPREILADVESNPAAYTPWFREIMLRIDFA